jgi:hypothetical protein
MEATSLLGLLLLLQWAESLPAGRYETETICNLAAGVNNSALHAVKSLETPSPAVLPAGAAAWIAQLSVSVATQQQQQHTAPCLPPDQEKQPPTKQASQQQQQQQQPQQQKQYQSVVVPPTPFVTEMLPLLIKLCKARLGVLGSRKQQADKQQNRTQIASLSAQAPSLEDRTLDMAGSTVCYFALLLAQLPQSLTSRLMQ